MKKDENISEEQLNAFVDGELESEETSCLFNEAERSAEIDQRLCQQRKLKELVKHAYRDVPEPRRLLAGRRTPRNMMGIALAASVLLVLGAATGLFVHGFFDQQPHPGGLAATTGTQAITTAENYILHVISGEPEQMRTALIKAQEILSAAEPGRPRQVEVVANERGLDMLRSDITPFSSEISALANENVIFYACSKAIQRLEEKGIEVKLVPEAIPGYTALDRVVIRMKDGWQYVKI
jgi:intracellular sulfur oxidation DsrE/DsrF family protein